jgi:hypothetical protein
VTLIILVVLAILAGLISPGTTTFATRATERQQIGPAQVANTPELFIEGTTTALPGETVKISIFLSTARGNNIQDLYFTFRFEDIGVSFDQADADGNGIPDALRLTNNVPSEYAIANVLFGSTQTTDDIGISIRGGTFPDNFNDKIVELELKVGLDAIGTKDTRRLSVEVAQPDIQFIETGDTLPIQTVLEIITSNPTILGNATPMRADITLSEGFYIEWYPYGTRALPPVRPDLAEPPASDSTELEFYYPETGQYTPIAELYTPEGTFVFSDVATIDVIANLGVESSGPTYVGGETQFTTPFTTTNEHRIFEGVEWYFGDGTLPSLVNSPVITHEYETVGTYNVTGTLRIKPEERDVYTSDAAPFNTTVEVLPPTLTLDSVKVIPLGETALITATIENLALGTSDLRVDFGDGSDIRTLEDIPIAATQQIPITYTYDMTGTMIVSATLVSERFGAEAAYPRATTDVNVGFDPNDPDNPVCPICDCPIVQAGPPATITVGTADNRIAGNEESTTVITATVLNEENLPLQGQEVTFSTSQGTILLPSATTNADGEVSTVLRSSVVTTEDITATVKAETGTPVISDTVNVGFFGPSFVFLPIVLPVMGETAPVAEEPAPIVEEPAPIVEEPAPIVEEPAPIVDDTEPITDTTEPITDTTEPITDTTEPITDTTEPITDTTEPITDTTEPITDTTEPITDTTEPITITRSLQPANQHTGLAGTEVLFSALQNATPRQATCPPCDCPEEPVFPSTEPVSLTVGTEEPVIPADGSSTATISATVRGASGEPVYGQEVVFTTSLGNVMIGRATTNIEGTAQTLLQSGREEGLATVRATVNPDLADTVDVTLTGPSVVYLPVVTKGGL